MSWKFWKKDDLALPDMNSSFGLNTKEGGDLSSSFEPTMPPMPPMPPSQSSFQPNSQSSFPSSFSQNYPQNTQSFSPSQSATQLQSIDDHPAIQKDLEIITAKLDTIKAQLETLTMKVAGLEQKNETRKPW